MRKIDNWYSVCVIRNRSISVFGRWSLGSTWMCLCPLRQSMRCKCDTMSQTNNNWINRETNLYSTVTVHVWCSLLGVYREIEGERSVNLRCEWFQWNELWWAHIRFFLSDFVTSLLWVEIMFIWLICHHRFSFFSPFLYDIHQFINLLR